MRSATESATVSSPKTATYAGSSTFPYKDGKKVCPVGSVNSPPRPKAPGGGITQLRTNFVAHLCTVRPG